MILAALMRAALAPLFHATMPAASRRYLIREMNTAHAIDGLLHRGRFI